MPTIKGYDVFCDICEKEYSPRLGGDRISDLADIGQGWFTLQFGWKVAAICPECQIKVYEFVASLPHSPASDSRPDVPRKDGRTGNERSEEGGQ